MKKPAKHLYFPLEIKARELESKLMLCSEACCQGFAPIIGHNSLLQRGLVSGALQKGLFFDKSLSAHKYKKFRDLSRTGNSVASIDEESGLLSFDYSEFIKERSSIDTATLASAIFCWGSHDAESWKGKYPNLTDKIHATGSPRVDFWRPEFSSYYEGEVTQLKTQYPNLVLIASNFAGNNGYLSLEELLIQGHKNGSIANQRDEENAKIDYKDNDKMRGAFISLVNNLAEQFPKCHFVVRPHPVEKFRAWTQNLASKPNVHVVFAGPITTWVRAADAILHNGCTTAIEAYALNKPAIAYEPFTSRLNREVPNCMSFVARNQAAVSDALKELYNSGSEMPERYKSAHKDALLKRRFRNLSGPLSVDLILRELHRLNLFSGHKSSLNVPFWLVARKFSSARWVDNLLKSDRHITRKYPGLAKSEIEAVIKKLALVRHKYANLSVITIYPGIYEIVNNNPLGRR